MFGIMFGTESIDEGGLTGIEARLASEIIVLILTRRADEHHATTLGPRQERNRIEKTLAEIPTMS